MNKTTDKITVLKLLFFFTLSISLLFVAVSESSYQLLIGGLFKCRLLLPCEAPGLIIVWTASQRKTYLWFVVPSTRDELIKKKVVPI